MTNEDIRRDAIRLALLTAQGRAFEAWYSETSSPIRERLVRAMSDPELMASLSGPPITTEIPTTIFEQYRCLDLGLRGISAPAHEDRKYLSEIRCWLHDGMDELVAFDLDRAITLIEAAANQLDWVLRGRSRAGTRRYRILDEDSKTRIEGALAATQALWEEVAKVRSLVSA